MDVWSWLVNGFNAATGKNQNFDELLKAGDISRATSLMIDNTVKVSEALKTYKTETHSVMKRQDKSVFGKKDALGNRQFLRFEKRWKIPVPYPVYINEIALVFMYGRPIKWSQESEGTDKAFAAFQDVIKSTRFNSKIRQAKRLAGAETQSAMLFHVYRNDEGKADLLIKVLAKSLGDDIYFRKDQYDRLTAFARGYTLTEAGGSEAYHLDIFTKEKIYWCKKAQMGWDIEEQQNLIGKIPVILFEQEAEFDGVEPMIERKEWMMSRIADVNDRFSDPTLVMTSAKINSVPGKEEEGKILDLQPSKDGSVMPKVEYLTWNEASESKKNEGEELDFHILNKTFTPKIDFEAMKGLGNMSAKALKQLMIVADIKAAMRKETHDEYADRIGNLSKAIIGNVLDISLKSECNKLILGHEFQEPFGEDVSAMIDDLVKSRNAGGLSEETFIEMNPIVKNPELEKERIEQERERDAETEARRYKMDVFGSAE